jgi:hypothetical protein
MGAHPHISNTLINGGVFLLSKTALIDNKGKALFAKNLLVKFYANVFFLASHGEFLCCIALELS